MAVRPGKRKGPPFWAGREVGSGSSGALNRILSGQISRGSPPVGAYLPHLARFPGDRRPGPPAGSKPERAPQRPENPARQGPALRRELHCGRRPGRRYLGLELERMDLVEGAPRRRRLRSIQLRLAVPAAQGSALCYGWRESVRESFCTVLPVRTCFTCSCRRAICSKPAPQGRVCLESISIC